MRPIRRDSIPPRTPHPLPSPQLDGYAEARYNKDYGGTIKRFMDSDAQVWEIVYNTDTHIAYIIQASFAQARKRLGLGRVPIIAVRGPRVFLGKPGWETYAPAAPRTREGTAADRAYIRSLVTDALLDFDQSSDTERTVTIPGDQTALYHALHYQRGRLSLSITVSRDGDRIVLTKRGTD